MYIQSNWFITKEPETYLWKDSFFNWQCCTAKGTQHYNNLEGWDGEGHGREAQKGGDTGVPMADSCSCLTENNKIL